METLLILMVVIFCVGYAAIALEHVLHVNKAGSALFLAVACWTLFSFSTVAQQPLPLEAHATFTAHELRHHLGGIAEILFFLLGAMTIVELISSHNGFSVITNRIRTRDKRKLMWIVSWITYFLSSVLDNLTTAIIMVSLLRTLVKNQQERMVFASLVIIAANAGGAWSPIGDVTTTMLWIGGQISATGIMQHIFVPSVVCLLIPLIYQSAFIKGELENPASNAEIEVRPGAKLVFGLGLGALVFTPIFKTVTHLPPYIGILLGVSVLWIVTELMHHEHEDRADLRIHHALTKNDMPSVLFFLGILLAVASLESAGILELAARGLETAIGNQEVILTVLGLLSAIVDNVPLTAAVMGMYDLATIPMDSETWLLLAYAVGTGGSCLIIGSAAGVVVMGMEKINFVWYMKKITFTALIGYFAGIAACILLL